MFIVFNLIFSLLPLPLQPLSVKVSPRCPCSAGLSLPLRVAAVAHQQQVSVNRATLKPDLDSVINQSLKSKLDFHQEIHTLLLFCIYVFKKKSDYNALETPECGKQRSRARFIRAQFEF